MTEIMWFVITVPRSTFLTHPSQHKIDSAGARQMTMNDMA